MASCFSALRVCLQTVSMIVLLAATALTLAAIFTPHWTTVDISQPPQRHFHGLFEDCVEGARTVKDANYVCAYKEFSSGHDEVRTMQDGRIVNMALSQGGHHHGEPWILAVLCLMVSATLIGLTGLFFGCCAGCARACSVAWNVLCLTATLCCLIGCVVFIRNAKDPRNKFVLAATETTEQRISWSFYLAVAATICFLISTLLSIPTTILAFVLSGRTATASNPQQTWAEKPPVYWRTELQQPKLPEKTPSWSTAI